MMRPPRSSEQLRSVRRPSPAWLRRVTTGFVALATACSSLALVLTATAQPAAAATATVVWNSALSCGVYDYAVVPPGTTSITATIYGGGGGGAAGSGTGSSYSGSAGGGGITTVTYSVSPGTNIGIDIGCGGGNGTTTTSSTAAGGGLAGVGYTSGGTGGSANTQVSGDPAGGGGAGGGSTGLCSTSSTTTCNGGTLIAIAPGGGGGGSAGGNDSKGCGNGAGGAGGGGGAGSTSNAGAGGPVEGGGGTAGSAGGAGTEQTGSPSENGDGYGGGGGGQGLSNSTTAGTGGGGGGGTGGKGGGNSSAAAGNNAGGGAGNTGSPGAGGSSTSGTGGGGGTGAAGSYQSMGGGGGGGGYTGGGGGGSSSCNGTALVGSGGGGGGSSWISSTNTSQTSFGGVTSTNSSSTCAFGTDPGYGGGGTGGSAVAGYRGCAGNVTSATWTGNAPGTPTVTSGSLSFTAGTAGSATFSSPTGTSYTESGTLPSGVIFNASTGVLSGTTSATGSYPITVTATNGFGTSAADNATLIVTGGAATQLVITTQPSATETSGAALAQQPVVKVEDSAGNVVTSVNSGTATASIASGAGGSIAAGGTSGTFSNGVATFSTLALNGVSGNVYTLTFTGDSFTSVASSNITMSTGNATQLVITTQPSGAASGSALTGQPVVKVEDSGGNVVTTASGTMTATINTGTGGNITAGSTASISGGVATFSTLTMTGVAGNSYSLHFSNGTLSVNSGSFTMTFGNATQLVIATQPSATETSGAALTQQPVVQVEDSGGNVVTSVNSGTASATINSGAGGSIAAGGTSGTFSNGVATFSTLALNGVSGNVYTLTFTGDSFTSVASSNITMSAGGATQLVIATQPSATETSGAALTQQPVVKVEDSAGNVVTSVNSGTATASIASGAGGSIAAGGTSGTFSNGVATFSTLALNGVSGNVYTLTFTGDSFTSVASSNITMSTGNATQLVITTQPSGAASGSALTGQPVVKVEDSGGNVVTTASGTMTATINTGTGGNITAGSTASISGGVATFSTLTMTGVAGNSYSLHFSNGTLSVNSGSFTMTFGNATQLVIATQPSATETSGAALTQQPVVKVEDSAGNVVTSVNSGTATASIASGAGGSIAAGGTSGTFSNGVATFSTLALNGVSGNVYTLTFTGDSFTSVASSNITMSTGNATQLVITTQPSGAASGSALTGQPVVKVEDSGGNVVTTASGTMTATINTGTGGNITAGSTASISGGVATFSTLTMTGVAGNSYSLHFSNGTLSVNSGSFTMTFGNATQLVIATQPSATETSGAALAQQPVVKVEDSGGNVVTSVSSGTASAAINSGAGGSIAAGGTSGTFSNGVATFSGLALNGVNGTVYTLKFTGDGFTSGPSSGITMSTGAATQLVFGTQPSNTAAGSSITPAVTVSVEDANGNVVTSATTSITIAIGTNPGGGTLSGTTPVSAVSGVATFSNLSINKVGTGYTLTAAGGGYTGATSSTFNITAGGATQLVFGTQPSNTAAGSSITPAVTVSVEDANGNVVTSATTSITIAIGTNPGGGTLSGTTPVSAVSGVATFSNLSINKVGTGYTLTAAGGGYTGATSSTFNITAGGATQLVFGTQPSNTAAGSSITPAVTVSVEDANGNVVTSATTSITIAIGTNPGGGTLSGTTPVSAVSGVATFSNLSINKVGTGYTLTAAGGGYTGATSSTFNITAGGATQLVFGTQPSNTAAGSSITPAVTVSVEDANGNVVTSATTSITIAIGTNPGGGTLSGTTPVSAVSGVATFSNLSINKVGTGYTLTAAGGGYTGATSSTFNITAGGATQLVFGTQPSNTAAGSSITPAVTVSVEDANGNVVTSATTSITIAIGTNPGGGTLSGTTPVSAVSGVATFSNLSINKVGTGYTLTAAGGGYTGATSSTFNITAGGATQLVFGTQPSNTAAGSSITPAVTVSVEDANGNVVTSATTSITIAIGTNPGGGTLSGTTPVSAVSGVATFSNLSINKVGTGYTLTAAGGGYTGATSSTFNITAGGATQLVFTTTVTGNQTASSTASIGHFAVQAQDSFGNPVTNTGSAVTLTLSTSSTGTLNPTHTPFFTTSSGGSSASTVTIANGASTSSNFYYSDTLAGTPTLMASGTVNSQSVSGTVGGFTVVAAAANQLVFVQGPSNAYVGTAMSPAVTVQVEDQFGNAAPDNISVTLTPSAISIASGASASTNSSGLATFSGITFNTTALNVTLTASPTSSGTGVSGSPPSGQFDVTVLVVNGATLTDTASDAGSGVASVSYYYCSGYSVTCTASNWHLIGISTSASPYSVTWTGQPTDGAYEVVAVGTDNVDNVSNASPSTPVTVGN
jgi:frataxin-like iron-binding protein CyaY